MGRRGVTEYPKRNGGSENEPPFHGRMEMCLLYDGFFSFAVVRQFLLILF